MVRRILRVATSVIILIVVNPSCNLSSLRWRVATGRTRCLSTGVTFHPEAGLVISIPGLEEAGIFS